MCKGCDYLCCKLKDETGCGCECVSDACLPPCDDCRQEGADCECEICDKCHLKKVDGCGGCEDEESED